MLDNKLKIILPEVIGQQQSDFAHGRLIIENILIAYESIQSIKKKQWKKVCVSFDL
jgi:hypothetical protein